ncbi:MAG: TolC family protein [Candidatus Omnitrophica bacterium]|nr:TolC family protein [Candidatus Omnitrophota bacterium]
MMQHFNKQPTRQRIVGLLLSASVMWQAAAIPAVAADGAALSLPSLLDEARRVNPDLRAARKRWEAAQARVPLSKGLPAPRIGVEWEEIPKGTVKLDQAMLMYQLIQALPFPGKLSARKRVAVKEAQMAAMMFKQAEWDLISQVKAAYYDLYLLDRELEIQQEQLLWLEQAVAAARARYASGTGMQAELLAAQADALEASNMRSILLNRRQATAAHLNHLLNRASHEGLGEPAPLALAPLPLSPEELLLTARERQPELLVFRYSAERAEASWRLAKRELLPDLETMLELRDPAMGPVGPWDLTLALVLPFWFWTKQRYGVRGALYDKESAQAAYEGMQNEIAKRIHEHWHEAMAAYRSARLASDGLIPLGQQAVASAMAAYIGGQGPFMELVDALRMLSERRLAYYRELVNLEQHVAMLEQAAGVELRHPEEP